MKKNTMQELSTVKELVRFILSENRLSRNSDTYLYLKVIEHQAEQRNIDLSMVSVDSFFLCAIKDGFANYESVRRVRQKLQADYPELRGDARVQAAHRENEAAFREWAVE